MDRPLKNTWGIILAAGSGTRLAEASGGVRKQYLKYRGVPLFWHSARTFSRVSGVKGLVFVFPPEDAKAMAKQVRQFFRSEDLGVKWAVCEGGERRQDSVSTDCANCRPSVTVCWFMIRPPVVSAVSSTVLSTH